MRRMLFALLSTVTATCRPSGGDFPSQLGTWEDIDVYVSRLVNGGPHAVLVIGVYEGEPFIQFSAYDGIVQMDFPMVTPVQQGRESHIRAFFERQQLELVENFGSDGARFLDCDSLTDAAQISRLTRAAFKEIFGVTEDTRLVFSAEDLGVAP